MPAITRGDSSQLETVLDELKNSSDGFCVIPKSMMELLIQENIQHRSNSNKVLQTLTRSIDSLNVLLEKTCTIQSSTNNDICTKLDALIEKLSNNNNNIVSSQTNTQDAFNIDSELKKRKETVEKITRNEELSKYYQKLIEEDQPFVRREFRTQVNKTTGERELIHRRKQAVDKVKTEIAVMQDRVVEYLQKTSIDERIQTYIAANEDSKTEIEEQMNAQDRTAKELFERNTLMKLKQTDDDEKMNTFEYLLKFSDHSLNSRGQSSRGRIRASHRRGGRRWHQQESWTSAVVSCR